MTAHDVEYIEIHTGDPEGTLRHFTSGFGFRELARAADDGLDSVLLQQGGVRLVVSWGPAASDFLAAHGDGVADIALSCADPVAVHDRALAAGARSLPGAAPDAPVVSGFGTVRHTLVRRVPGAPADLPPGRAWTVTPPKPSAGVPALRSLDHIAVCLEAGTLRDTVRFYLDGFGFEQYYSEYVAVGEQAMDSIVVRSPSAGVTFTILEPDTALRPGQIDEFLERNGGSGVQHLAFLTDEIVPAVLDFEARDVTFLRTPSTYYDALAERIPDLAETIADLRKTNVLADRDEWGFLLQLFTRSPFERRTLFFELIQRRGAQGFGSANIRALYEAVERARAVTA
ncbi:4-hydroxyphenylpyruvate dioxygenase [Streptomyces sp. NPDC005930]|uniref:4-hydroxyphenylpyruvate dioxygenase n=1 Tax=Streptomyces sp. NPDC005930 TaxID=3364736 RepID=UPI0036AD5001